MANSVEIQAALVATLKEQAQISESESIYKSVSYFVKAAYAEHAPDNNNDFTLLKRSEYEQVVILAWARACMSRASFVAPQSSLKGAGAQGFGSDRDTPFEKNIKLARALREEYTRLRDAIAANSSITNEEEAAGDIIVGDFFREDELIGARVPLYLSAGLKMPPLKAKDITAGPNGTVVLEWESIEASDFGESYLMQATVAGIHQNWNLDGNAPGGVPMTAVGSTVAYSTTDNIQRATKIGGFPSGTYYFVLVVRDTSYLFHFSNEVTVVIP